MLDSNSCNLLESSESFKNLHDSFYNNITDNKLFESENSKHENTINFDRICEVEDINSKFLTSPYKSPDKGNGNEILFSGFFGRETKNNSQFTEPFQFFPNNHSNNNFLHKPTLKSVKFLEVLRAPVIKPTKSENNTFDISKNISKNINTYVV